MDQGVIAETGSYEQLMGHNGAFAKFMKTYLTEHNSDSDSDEEGTKLSMTLLFRDLVTRKSDFDACKIIMLQSSLHKCTVFAFFLTLLITFRKT